MKKNYNLIKKIALFLLGVTSLTNFNAKAQAPDFGYVKIGGGGYVCSIIESPNEDDTFYAKSDVGGIYKWNEATAEWTPLFGWVNSEQTTYLGTEAFAIDPSAPNKVYALAGTSYWNSGKTAFLRSSDYGQTYEVVDVTAQFKANGNGSDRQKGETLAIDPANGNIMYCGTRYSNGLFKSINAGKSWAKVTSFPDSIGLKASFSFVVIDDKTSIADTLSKGCQTIYVGVHKTGNNVFKSEDGGKTWVSINGNKGGKPQRCVLSADRFLYVTYTNGTGAVAKYNTLTGAWSIITPQTGRGYSGIDVDRNSPNKVVVTTYNFWSAQQPWSWGDQVFYSENGGTTWVDKLSKANSTQSNNGITWMQGNAMHWAGCATMSKSKPGRVFVVSGNGVFATDNITAAKPAWKVVSHGLEETVPIGPGMISVLNGPLISALGDVGGFVHTNINEYPKAKLGASDAFCFAALKPSMILRTNDVTVGAKTFACVYLSEDKGATWRALPSSPDSLINATVAVSADGSIIMRKTYNSTVGVKCYWTADKGVTWNLSNLNFNATPVGDAVNPLIFYAFNTSSGYLNRSDDGGKTFRNISYVSTGGSSLLQAALGKEGHIWMNNNGKIKYSENKGVTFITTTNYSCASFALGKEAPGTDYPTIYFWGKVLSGNVTDAMYRSIDKGLTWVRANDNQHQWGSLANAGMIEADKNVYGRVYKTTAGMGIPWMGLVGYTSVENIKDYKVEVELFPIPFASEITLKAKNANINLIQVYNLQGALVKTIQVDMYNNESVSFGAELNPGVYLVKVSDKFATTSYKIVKN